MLFDPAHPATVGLLNFMTFVILYSTLIPISLYVSIELIKFFQATKFINQVGVAAPLLTKMCGTMYLLRTRRTMISLCLFLLIARA